MKKPTLQRLVLVLFLGSAIGNVKASNETSGVKLENTTWILVRLVDKPIVEASLQREAYLVLKASSGRVAGSGGCNRLTGSYKLNGDRLTFSHMSVTMIACARGMETEKSFLAELRNVATWKLDGMHLELLDAGGTLVAAFDPGPTK